MKSIPTLLTLPLEIIDAILSELDTPRTILAFALTSHLCARLVIPTHIEYRIISTRAPLPSLWFHLARRPDLGGNVREVHFRARSNYAALDQYPKTLVRSLLPHKDRDEQEQKLDDEHERIKNVCTALRHMKRLRVFEWDYQNDFESGLILNHSHEESILKALLDSNHDDDTPFEHHLKHLSLRGSCGAHVIAGRGISRDPYPLWGLQGLESLTLDNNLLWRRENNLRDIESFIQHSPDIEFLQVPEVLCKLQNIRLPRLKRLDLLFAHMVSPILANSVVSFVFAHPTIEEFSWLSSPGPLPQSHAIFLPNLRRLHTTGDFFFSFVGAAGPTPRRLEALEVMVVNLRTIIRAASTLLEPHILTHLSLTAVRLTSMEVPDLKELSNVFPEIIWLEMPGGGGVSLAEWLEILPLFKKLEVFAGPALWDAIRAQLGASPSLSPSSPTSPTSLPSSPSSPVSFTLPSTPTSRSHATSNDACETAFRLMHHIIFKLIAVLPRLRRIDHDTSNKLRRAPKVIRIFREAKPSRTLGPDDGSQEVQKEEPEQVEERVWYEVHRPPHRDIFDALEGIFAD